MQNWRLLLEDGYFGAENMAVDFALLKEAVHERHIPTLRFFTWKTKALSVGYLQKIPDDVLQRCRRQGVVIVKRPTGGYAVLHDKDLCYSLVVPLNSTVFPSGLTDASLTINRSLLKGLQLLGLPAELTFFENNEQRSSFTCAASSSLNEVTIRGKKIIGSAYVKRKGFLLQQGSITLNFNAESIKEILPGGTGEENLFTSGAVGIEQELGRNISIPEIKEALCKGFTDSLNVHLFPGKLNSNEIVESSKMKEKFVVI